MNDQHPPPSAPPPSAADPAAWSQRASGARWLGLLRWSGTLLTGGLFVWLLSGQDWQQLLAYLRGVPLWVLVVALVLFLGGQMLNGLRWYSLLHAQQVPVSYWQVTRLVFVGAFSSNFLPTTVGGDMVRVAGILRHTDNWAVGVGSIVLERLLNMLAAFSAFPLPLLVFGGQVVPRLQAGLLVGLPGLLVGWFQRALDWLGQHTGPWQKIRAALRVWRNQPVVLALGFGVSWLSILAIIAGTWLVALGLGIAVGLHEVLSVTLLVYVVIMLPVSINGYGVREVVFTALYSQLGATLEQATALALLTRLLMVASTLPGGLWLPGLLAQMAAQSASDPVASPQQGQQPH